MAPRIFIDGEAGTTGLQIRARLAKRTDIEILSIPPQDRKDRERRAELLNAADLVILCLPDDASREAVDLIENPNTQVIDTSTAHRVADAWIYGIAELEPGRREAIASSKRVSNPGCYALAVAVLTRPLVDAELIAPTAPISVHAVSGLPVGRFYRNDGGRREEVLGRKRDSLKRPVQPIDGRLPAGIAFHEVVPEALAAWYDQVITETAIDQHFSIDVCATVHFHFLCPTGSRSLC